VPVQEGLVAEVRKMRVKFLFSRQGAKTWEPITRLGHLFIRRETFELELVADFLRQSLHALI
jgi:hypothetical protein